MNTVEEIVKVLKSLKSAVIFTHTRPDGDAIGSALALSCAFTFLGIENEVVNEDEMPESFFFLPGAQKIRRAPTLDAAGYVAVDCSDVNRFGELQKVYLRGAGKGKVTVNIDHHISNNQFAKYNYVRECSSNCENITAILLAMEVPVTPEMATCLMAGLVTDSGGFSHNDVNGDTFRMAALASDAGADVSRITYELCTKQSLPRARMYAEAVAGIRFLLNDRLAVAVVPSALLKKYGLKPDSTSGIVDFALTIDVVEVSICIMEAKEGQYKVSFRSKGKVDVNAVAERFGGGGHVRASGCMLFGDKEEVIDRLRYAVSQFMEGA